MAKARFSVWFLNKDTVLLGEINLSYLLNFKKQWSVTQK